MPHHGVTMPVNRQRGQGDIVPLHVPGGHDLPAQLAAAKMQGAAGPPVYYPTGGAGGAYGIPPDAYTTAWGTPGQGGGYQPAGNVALLPAGPGGRRIPVPVGTHGSQFYLKNPWAPEFILPDAMLPVGLRRTRPDFGPFWSPNAYDQRILREAFTWKWITEHGGLKGCCRIGELGAPIYDTPPWLEMPANGIRLEKMFSQPITAFEDGDGAFTGLDVVIGSYRIPFGFDASIVKVVVQTFNVTGWEEFSGNIIWRVKVGQRYLKSLGNITNTYGSFTNAMLTPLSAHRVISGQTVQLIANVPVGSPAAGGVIAAGFFGWEYPRN